MLATIGAATTRLLATRRLRRWLPAATLVVVAASIHGPPAPPVAVGAASAFQPSHPTLPELRDRGLAALKSGMWAEAIDALACAWAQQPFDDQVRWALTRAVQELGEPGVERLLGLLGRDPSLLRAIVLELEQRHLPSAVMLYDRLIPDAPSAQRVARLPVLPAGDELKAALRLPMRSRVAPLTMEYWGAKTEGAVLLDSLAERRLFPRFDHVTWHRWLADGSLVLLDGERLYRVSGAGTRRFLAAVGKPQVAPRLSPDGRWVAVAVERSITLVAADGHRVKRLPQPGWVHSLCWHPDSKRLAFSAGNRIRVASIEGTVETLREEPVTRPAAWEEAGAAALWKVPQVEWSGDGRLLAYRLILRSKRPDGKPDYETRLFVLEPHGQVWEVIGDGNWQDDGLFSWAPAGDVLAWTGTGGDVHSACFLWTPRESAEVVETGTEPTYYRTAWQPHGELLVIEETYGAEAWEWFGPAGTFHETGLYVIKGIGAGGAREDDWPGFEWAPSGRAFAVIVSARSRVDDPAMGYSRLREIGDFGAVGHATTGQWIQGIAVGAHLADQQWRPGEREVSCVRELGGGESGLIAAPVLRGAGGLEEARRWLIKGKRSYRQGRLEEAAVGFRNAVRCEPNWAEPRVRLARCYLDLSERERNPACMAWLLDGAEFEMRRAESVTRLSDESQLFRVALAARRARLNQAVGLPTLERWSWDHSLSARAPSWRPQPISLSSAR